ncbi:MAG: DUF2259 domain-containing protein [Spirochaetaceae bacterium]|nr:DUF2259 domain-containing protein [Spirochaetaceae bacterium]
MKRISIFAVMLFLTLLYAQTNPAFIDIGFSPDGAFYCFAEYGRKAEKNSGLRGYAEVYAVDVAKNEFINGGRIKTAASFKTENKSGWEVFKTLRNENPDFFSSKNFPPKTNSVLLYQSRKDEEKKQIEFRDFEHSTEENTIQYNVKLVEYSEGSGTGIATCFYLLVELKNEKNEVTRRLVVGNPKTKRVGVKGYALNSILSDSEGTSLVFVIEKKIAGENGDSVQYMVETVKL